MLKEETLPLLCMFLPPGTKPPPARTMRMTGDKVLPSSSGLPPQSQSGGRDDESEGEGGGGGGQRTSGPRRQSEQGGGGRKPIRHIAGGRSPEAKKAFLSLLFVALPSPFLRRFFCLLSFGSLPLFLSRCVRCSQGRAGSDRSERGTLTHSGRDHTVCKNVFDEASRYLPPEGRLTDGSSQPL